MREIHNLDARADDGALDKLPSILDRAFKYEEDYTNHELLTHMIVLVCNKLFR